MDSNIISFSGGKDSTAMAMMMLERKEPIHSVVWFDTGWEFPQMHDHIRLFERISGLNVVRMEYHRPFDDLLVRYGWPEMRGRWCTRGKISKVNSYVKRHKSMECIGFASDELRRTQSKEMSKKPVRFPLVELGITEKIALEICRSYGFHWDGLYDVFDRVSCFCCPLGGIRDARKLRANYPKLWSRVLEMDDSIKNNRGYCGYETAHDLDERFRYEDKQLHMFRRQHGTSNNPHRTRRTPSNLETTGNRTIPSDPQSIRAARTDLLEIDHSTRQHSHPF